MAKQYWRFLLRAGSATTGIAVAATAASSPIWFPWGRAHVAAPPPPDVRRSGLVSKWDDAFYGRELPDPVAAGELLLTPGLLWAAAEKDAAAAKVVTKEYLLSVRKSAAECLGASGTDGLPRVVNHEGTLAALRALGEFDGKGKLLMLTGARSLGKSLMLQTLAKELAQQKRRVVYVDARQYGPDLTRGIISAIARDRSFFEKVLDAAPMPIVAALVKIADEVVQVLPLPTPARIVVSGAIEGAKAASDAATAATAALPLRLDDVLGVFFAACKREGTYPTIFIDEANEAFRAAQGNVAAAERVLMEMNLFTRVTKQENEASVLLATSEHGLPFRLRALGWNTNHITGTIVAEEVPPKIMKDELMRHWGCGEHLATALLSMYGGHVLHASEAVRMLATSTDPASMKGILPMGSIVSAPALCLSDKTLTAAGVPASGWPEMRERVTEALRALVVKGSVPLGSEEDKIAEIISLANAGCVVPVAAVASGVLPSAWLALTPNGASPTHILAPSSHMMRLLIAREVFPRGKSLQ